MGMTRTKAVGYIRVSTDKQDLSPSAQREVLMRWAVSNSINLVKIYEETCSGGVPWYERPVLSEAVQELKAVGAAWLVVAKIDRLSRDLFNQLHLQKELEKLSASTISCTENPEDEKTPERELMRNMLGSFAQFEKSMIRERTVRAIKAKKARGEYHGGRRFEHNELGRVLVWAVWRCKDLGHSISKTCQILRHHGARGPRGGRVHRRLIYEILAQPRPTERPEAYIGFAQTWKQSNRDAFIRADAVRNHKHSQKVGRHEASSDSTGVRTDELSSDETL